MEKNIELSVQPRSPGKSKCRKLRRNNNVPGIIYGAGKKNIPLFAEEKFIKKYSTLQYENAIITLKSEDKDLNDVKVLFKEVVVQPVTRRPIHIDLLAVDLNKAVRVYVELRFEGKAEGTREGGILQPLVREIEIECLPMNIPEYISVDVTPLQVGNAIHLKEITLPADVKLTPQEDVALVTVTIIEEEDLSTPTVVAATTATDATAPASAGGAASTPATDKKEEKK